MSQSARLQNNSQKSLLAQMITFALPLIAMHLLQLVFNATDMIVVGRFAGSNALAAVGSTGSLIGLLTNTFMGTSIGANVLIAQRYGAGDKAVANDYLHTSLTFAAALGFIVMAFGMIMCKPLLVLMGSPEEIINSSVLYMRLYFLGVPANLIYNFGAAALRAIGDSFHGTIYLMISGVLNIVLNLIFVVVFHMTVDGVAWATAISQWAAFIMLMCFLYKGTDCLQLRFSKLHIDWKKLGQILRIGIPSGITSSMYSISNVLIQSGVNSFGADMMAAHSAANQLEMLVNTCNQGIGNAGVTFTGQFIGAKNYQAINKVIKNNIMLVFIAWVALCGPMAIFAEDLLTFYTNDVEVAKLGLSNIYIRLAFQCFNSLMSVLPGIMRGMGYSTIPMCNTIFFTCGMRVIWVSTMFRWFPSIEMLIMVYPVTWVLSTLAHGGMLIYVKRKVFREAGVLPPKKPKAVKA